MDLFILSFLIFGFKAGDQVRLLEPGFLFLFTLILLAFKILKYFLRRGRSARTLALTNIGVLALIVLLSSLLYLLLKRALRCEQPRHLAARARARPLPVLCDPVDQSGELRVFLLLKPGYFIRGQLSDLGFCRGDVIDVAQSDDTQYLFY